MTKKAMLEEEELDAETHWDEDFKGVLHGIVTSLRVGKANREAKKALETFKQWRSRMRCTMLKALSIVPLRVGEIQNFRAPLPLSHKYRHYRMHNLFFIEESQSTKLRENDSWKIMWKRHGYRVLSVFLDCMVHSIADADRLSKFFHSSYSFLHYSASLEKNICHTKIWSFKTMACVADFVSVLQDYLVTLTTFEHLQSDVKNGLQTTSQALEKAMKSTDIGRSGLRTQASHVSPFISAWWTFEFLNQVGLYPSVEYSNWKLEGMESRSEPPDTKTSIYFLTEEILRINRGGDLKPHSRALRQLLQELLLVPLLESLRAEREEDHFPPNFESFANHDGLKQKLVSCYIKYLGNITSPGAKAWKHFHNPIEFKVDNDLVMENPPEHEGATSSPGKKSPDKSGKVLVTRKRGLHRNLRVTSEGPRYARVAKKRKADTAAEATDSENESDDESIEDKRRKGPNARNKRTTAAASKAASSNIESDDEPIADVIARLHPDLKISSEIPQATTNSNNESDDEPLASIVARLHRLQGTSDKSSLASISGEKDEDTDSSSDAQTTTESESNETASGDESTEFVQDENYDVSPNEISWDIDETRKRVDDAVVQFTSNLESAINPADTQQNEEIEPPSQPPCNIAEAQEDGEEDEPPLQLALDEVQENEPRICDLQHNTVEKEQHNYGMRIRERYIQVKFNILKFQANYWRAKYKILSRKKSDMI